MRRSGVPALDDAVGYRLEGVCPEASDLIQSEVVSFWLAENALPSRSAAEQRAHQLLVVARDADRRVAGVSTAVRANVPQLGFDCYYYRTFVGRAHRVKGLLSTDLFWQILRESYRLLNGRFRQGDDPGVLGLYAEIENVSIMRSRKDLVWQDRGMNAVYIGRTTDGRHVRVWYFEGAQIP